MHMHRRSAMPESTTLYVGMDVHHDSSAVADVATEHDAPVRYLGTLGTRQPDRDHLSRPLRSKATHRVFVYDAGPCGSWLYRYLCRKCYACWVVAPALLPQQAGDRVNTDRRAAGQLARLMRAGDLTPVDVPTVDEEALRALCRAREAALGDLKTAQCRLN